jgi:hypothetical protein
MAARGSYCLCETYPKVTRTSRQIADARKFRVELSFYGHAGTGLKGWILLNCISTIVLLI